MGAAGKRQIDQENQVRKIEIRAKKRLRKH